MRNFSVSSLLSVVAAGAVCLAASPARAGAPYVEVSDIVVDHEPMANCGDFKIIANGSGTARLTTFFDRNDNPIRLEFHGFYNGTMTNSVTGAVLLDAPSAVLISVDLVRGTQTNIGAFFTVTLPHQGVVLIEAGRIQFDGSGEPVFIAGPHLPSPDTLHALCQALR